MLRRFFFSASFLKAISFGDRFSSTFFPEKKFQVSPPSSFFSSSHPTHIFFKNAALKTERPKISFCIIQSEGRRGMLGVRFVEQFAEDRVLPTP